MSIQMDSDNSIQPNFKPTSPQNSSSSLSTIESGGSVSFSEQSSINKSQDDSCLDCCKCVTFALFYLGIVSIVMGLIGSVISYYVFGIKFLIKDYQTSEDCSSDVGNFVLVSLIVSFILGGSQANTNKNDDAGLKLCVNIFLSFFWLGWGIWGFIITQDEECEDLEDTNLIRYSNVISICFLSMGSLIIFICLASSVVIACKKG